MLVASGLIVGESLVGVLLAAVIGATGDEAPLAVVGAGFGPTAEWLGFVVFAAVAVWIYRRVVRTRPEQA
ncbi:oligopeptide transporter [Bordetella pertussis]|uniref:Uncharacterized protein n=1 Tax=Bordetella pertussis TaxID=520 RepID=A0A0E8CN37_BORPT|nr:membrane protein [Bordetella pertussis]ALX24374.1 membrane protein [Bordetella pertussis]AMS52160.1 membrane protein [Bordetella pertussis]AMS55791.1 membrane protein [Bordetella pertussis]AMS58062.1 membrane protein [Bordetella pertussis]